jgi:DNA-binding response OmpR family regulator
VATILVADSSAERRAELGQVLATFEHTTRYVDSGEQALAAARTDPPDLLIADAELHGIDGVALTAQMRQQFPGMPVLLVIDVVNKEVVATALRAGAAAYLPRQIAARELPGVVDELLNVAASQKRKGLFLQKMSAVEYRFDLESDPDLVPNMVSQAELLLSQMELFDDADRMRVGVGIHEALVNAIVHGNLGVSSDLKAGRWEEYHEAIAARRQTPPYCDRRVVVLMRAERRKSFFIQITDQGPGFDVSKLPDPNDPSVWEKPSGRGLILIRSFFDHMAHSPSGNEIRLSKRQPDATAE